MLVYHILVTSSGRVDAILMWWVLDMDGTGQEFIDMAPTWDTPDSYVSGYNDFDFSVSLNRCLYFITGNWRRPFFMT